MKPRVLMVGRTRYRLPLNGSLERKFARPRGAARPARPRGCAARGTGRRRDRSPCSAARRCPRSTDRVFYGSLPVRIARELRAGPADAILAQSPYEALAALAGRKLARSDAAVVVEIHGDWRTWSRLYGSPARAVVAPLADARLSSPSAGPTRCGRSRRSPTGIVREAGVEPAGVFTTYTELTAFSEPPVAPLPERAVRPVHRRPRAVQERPCDRRRLAARRTPRPRGHAADRR